MIYEFPNSVKVPVTHNLTCPCPAIPYHDHHAKTIDLLMAWDSLVDTSSCCMRGTFCKCPQASCNSQGEFSLTTLAPPPAFSCLRPCPIESFVNVETERGHGQYATSFLTVSKSLLFTI